MEALLDYCSYHSGSAIFSVNHKDENAISIVVPESDDDLNYLGINSCFSIPIGSNVEIIDDEGETHEIIRLT